MSTDVLIRLRGDVSDLSAKLGLAKANVASFASSATKQVGAFNAALAQSAEKREALNKLGMGFGIVGAAAAVGFAAVVASAANFDQAMSNVQAATHETAQNMELLRTAAIDAGQRTQFSASEAAAAITEMGKAGVDATDILSGGLTGALNLAAAGSLDVGQAGQIAATAMNQFGLAGKDIPHIADLLAASANKAQGEVTDMAAALNYVGPVAHQMGVSIEETAGAVAELASNGILGERAGTGLRGILSSLTSPSKLAADTMKKLGINVYDAAGNFVGFNGVAGQLHDKLGDLDNATRDAALGQIFGNAQITAARVLYEGGAAAVDKWTKAVDDQGAAADTAAIKMDNLKGDLEQLRGALETAFIGTGSGAQGPLREVVQQVTNLVNAYNKLPGPVKSGALAIAGLTAVIGLSAFAATRAMTAYAGMRANLATLGATASVAGKGMLLARGGALGAAVGLGYLSDKLAPSHQDLSNLAGAASFAAGALAFGASPLTAGAIGAAGYIYKLETQATDADKALAAMGDTVQTVVDALDESTGATTESAKGIVQTALSTSGAAAAADTLGVSLDLVTRAALGNHAAIAELARQMDAAKMAADPGQELEDAVNAYDVLGTVVGATASKVIEFREKLNTAREVLALHGKDVDGNRVKLDYYGSVLDDAGHSSFDFGASVAGTTPAIWDQAAAMAALIAKMKGVDGAIHALIDPELNLAAATDDWKSKLRGLNDALSTSTNRLKGNTDEAAKNRGVIRDSVSGILAVIDAEAKHHVSGPQMARDLQDMRRELVETGVQAGVSRKDMNDYLDVLGLTPKDVKTLVEVATDKANADLDHTQGKMTALDHATAHPRVTAETGSAQSAIDRILAQLNILDGKTVHTYVTTTESHVVSTSPSAKRASGGYVVGPGTGTSDSIPAWLSNGEFVVNAAATRRNLAALHAMNAQHFAGGGQAGDGPPGQPFGFADLIRLIIRGDIQATFTSVAHALAEMRDEARDVTEAERDLKAARENARDATHRVNQTERALSKTQEEISKERGKENVDLGTLATLQNRAARERERLKDQTKAQTQADRDQTRAEAELNRQKSQLTAAEQALKAERDQLIAQARAVAEAVTATGALFGGEGEASTPQGILRKVRAAASDAKTFRDDIALLRRRHLDQSYIDQLLAEGSTERGVADAEALAHAPQAVIRQLNAAERRLERLAAQVGSQSVRERDHRRDHRRGGGSGDDGIARGDRDGVRDFNVIFKGQVITHDPDEFARVTEKRYRQGLRIMGSP